MKFEMPAVLKGEHEELHRRLVAATREAGEIGVAAQEVARLLHPHIVDEELFALPPLGLLRQLAHGSVREEMADVLPMTRRLANEYGSMLEDHSQILEALEAFRDAARQHARPEYEQLARVLITHALTEEEILYPAAILVGKYLELCLQRERGVQTAGPIISGGGGTVGPAMRFTSS